MDIQNRRELKQEAAQALNAAHEPKKILLIYLAASMALSVVLTVLTRWLDHMVASTSGLGGMDTRTILQTVQMVLPYVQLVLVVCWDLGFLSAMVRISRRQRTDERELLAGFRLVGPALRNLLLQGALYFGLCMACSYVGAMIFLYTPFAAPLMELMTPLVSDVSMLTTELVLDEATINAMYDAMIPALAIMLLLFAAVAIPLSYRLRMVNYCLLENSRAGAIAAFRESFRMMKGNCMHLFKLDLSFWWYYGLTVLASIICYGDMLLPLMGAELPMGEMAAFSLFYGAYFAVLFAVNIPFRNQVEQTYAMAYEAIRPKPKDDGGVVLGNIFQM